MRPLCITTYLPAWVDAAGKPLLGPDEDAVTLAVSAGLPAVDFARKAGIDVDRVVLISRQPAYVEGNTTRVLQQALALEASCAVEERLGGGPAVLEAVTTSAAGTLVIAVDAVPAASGAVLVGDGDEIRFAGRTDHGLPLTIRATGSEGGTQYEDPRLLREQGWRPVLAELAGAEGEIAVVGVPPKEAKSLVKRPLTQTGPPVVGAAAPIFALASLWEAASSGTRVVAVEQGAGVAADVTAAADVATVLRVARPAQQAPESGFAPRVAGDIPIALPGYARAFASKVGLIGRRCECGNLHFPPRTQCLECGRIDASKPEPLPRDAVVYSVVTVHPPIPGLYGPYSLVVAELDDAGLRVLARVTDVKAGTVAIGAGGSLVLRRTAIREGIPDYDYAFQPNGVPA